MLKDGEKLPHTATFRYEYVACGKATCKTCGGSDYAHGPYWYAYWLTGGRKGQMHKVYVGKAPATATPAELRAKVTLRDIKRRARQKEREAREARAERERQHRAEGEKRQRAKRPTAAQDAADAALLGVPVDCSEEALRRAWRKKISSAHPDRVGEGGTVRAQAINEAHQRMLNRRGWRRV